MRNDPDRPGNTAGRRQIPCVGAYRHAQDDCTKVQGLSERITLSKKNTARSIPNRAYEKHFVHLRFLQKVICFVAASMVVVASGNAAIINLTGTVTDSATQKPIEGAKVKLALIPSCTTRTDVSGSYTLSGATTGALMQPLGNQSISAPFFRTARFFLASQTTDCV